MSEIPSHDNLDFLHLLMVPVVACVGWVMKQINQKATRSELKESIDALKQALTDMRHERHEMHVDNTRRLDKINEQLLDIVGGKYDTRR